MLPGYDAWKTREPDWDVRSCPSCGGWMRHSFSIGWHCEFCDERDAFIEAQGRDGGLASEEEIMAVRDMPDERPETKPMNIPEDAVEKAARPDVEALCREADIKILQNLVRTVRTARQGYDRAMLVWECPSRGYHGGCAHPDCPQDCLGRREGEKFLDRLIAALRAASPSRSPEADAVIAAARNWHKWRCTGGLSVHQREQIVIAELRLQEALAALDATHKDAGP